MKTKTGWKYLMCLNEVCNFTSREKSGKASNSELRRWCQNSVLRINGLAIKWEQEIPYPDEIDSVTLFTKSNIITILWGFNMNKLKKLYYWYKALPVCRRVEMTTCTFIIIGVIANLINIYHQW